jgi:hypothetical protein
MYDLGFSRLRRPTRTWQKDKKDLTYPEAKKMYNLDPFSDVDQDRVPNWKDCHPFDRSRQDDPLQPTSITPYQAYPQSNLLPGQVEPDHYGVENAKRVGYDKSPDQPSRLQPKQSSRTPNYTGGYYIYALLDGKQAGYDKDYWVNFGNVSIEEAPSILEQYRKYDYVKKVVVDKRPNLERKLNAGLRIKQGAKGVKKVAKKIWNEARDYSEEQGFRSNIRRNLEASEEGRDWINKTRARITGSRGTFSPPWDTDINSEISRDATIGSGAWARQSSETQQPLEGSYYQNLQTTPKESMRRQPIGSSTVPERPTIGQIDRPRTMGRRTRRPQPSVQTYDMNEPTTYDEDTILPRRSISDQAADLSTAVNWEDPSREPSSQAPKVFPPTDTPSIYGSTSPFARQDRKLPSAGIPGTNVQRYSPVTADQAILHKPLVGAPDVAQFGTPRGSRGFGLTTPREYQNYEKRPRGLGITGGQLQPHRSGGLLTRREPNKSRGYKLPTYTL